MNLNLIHYVIFVPNSFSSLSNETRNHKKNVLYCSVKILDYGHMYVNLLKLILISIQTQVESFSLILTCKLFEKKLHIVTIDKI